jgi:S-adenosylmethionine:tRNA ribosyltransferase-isomerase
MHISDFDYDLPPELIAHEPAEPRGASRMMVLDARTGRTTHARFDEFAECLRPSDVLVLNDTRVIRARTFALLERSGRALEIFFAEPVRENVWRVLCRPGRRIRAGDRVIFAEGEAIGVFQETHDNDLHVIELTARDSVYDFLQRYGHVPLPPYINRSEAARDEKNYQTVFAAHPGAVAAPTAGLHFTEPALQSIRARGVEVLYITLHVGIGTFLPVRAEKPEEHVLRAERFEVDAHTADRLQRALQSGRRVVAVGTTTTRTLEFLMRAHGEIREGAGWTDLYILPGFDFKIVGALLTNFHLPRSTLLMLVSAFAGRERILETYRRAIEERYRFYSYGDCMLITR